MALKCLAATALSLHNGDFVFLCFMEQDVVSVQIAGTAQMAFCFILIYTISQEIPLEEAGNIVARLDQNQCPSSPISSLHLAVAPTPSHRCLPGCCNRYGIIYPHVGSHPDLKELEIGLSPEA